jgi:hypothetical protein
MREEPASAKTLSRLFEIRMPGAHRVGMSRALLKFEKRALLFKSYAASAI